MIDTNILINHLLVLKQALSRINADISRLNVVMLVPGIVVSELDYQKNSARGVANESRKASSWLASEIGNELSRIRGQAYTQTMLPSGDWRQRSGVGTASNLTVYPSSWTQANLLQLSNDELILDCCKYFAHVKRKDVLLCTADNNLAVQAFGNGAPLSLTYYNMQNNSTEIWQQWIYLFGGISESYALHNLGIVDSCLIALFPDLPSLQPLLPMRMASPVQPVAS